MADQDIIDSADEMRDELADDLGERVSALQAEIRRLAEVLTDNGLELADRAEEAGEAIRGRAVRLADDARSEVAAVARTARDNPAVTGSILALVALGGFAVGFVVGANSEPPRRHRW
jgi:hypothetical protein